MRIGNGPAGLAQVSKMRRERFGHARLDFLARLTTCEDPVYVGTVGTPGPVIGLLVDDEVVLQRRSRSPVARRIAASVPTGTVSESLPATVTTRVRERESLREHNTDLENDGLRAALRDAARCAAIPTQIDCDGAGTLPRGA